MQTIKVYKSCLRDSSNEVLLSRVLSSPDGKLGDGMILNVRLASLSTGIHGRDFSHEELAGLCPIIRVIPNVLFDIMEVKPALVIEGLAVSLLYKLTITTSRAPSAQALNCYHASLLLALGPGVGITAPDPAMASAPAMAPVGGDPVARAEAIAVLNALGDVPATGEIFYEDRVGSKRGRETTNDA